MAQLRVVFKRFGQIEALKGIDLAIYQGEVVALLGPNGAGKTTAISLLLGVRRPDRGEARLFGHPPQLPQARCQIGATPQDTGFPGHLTVSEVVELVRGHYPQPLATTVILERFGLHDLAHRQTGGLSSGQRRRLAVALAFAGNPKVVFLSPGSTLSEQTPALILSGDPSTYYNRAAAGHKRACRATPHQRTGRQHDDP